MRIRQSQVMRMRAGFWTAILGGASAFCGACRAPAVFHRQNKVDQERLGELLKAHSRETTEIQIAGSAWARVTIFWDCGAASDADC